MSLKNTGFITNSDYNDYFNILNQYIIDNNLYSPIIYKEDIVNGIEIYFDFPQKNIISMSYKFLYSVNDSSYKEVVLSSDKPYKQTVLGKTGTITASAKIILEDRELSPIQFSCNVKQISLDDVEPPIIKRTPISGGCVYEVLNIDNSATLLKYNTGNSEKIYSSSVSIREEIPYFTFTEYNVSKIGFVGTINVSVTTDGITKCETPSIQIKGSKISISSIDGYICYNSNYSSGDPDVYSDSSAVSYIVKNYEKNGYVKAFTYKDGYVSSNIVTSLQYNIKNYLRLSGTNLKLSSQNKKWDGDVYYCLDTSKTQLDSGWSLWDGSEINASGTICLKGNNSSLSATSDTDYSPWKISGTNVSFDGSLDWLFNCNSIMLGNKSIIMNDYCCTGMFEGCTALINPPELPDVENLTNGCFMYMFKDCTSLQNIQSLDSYNYSDKCFYYMYYGSNKTPNITFSNIADKHDTGVMKGLYAGTNIQIMPSGFSNTTSNSCYESMFKDCHDLKTLSSLPATSVSDNAYNHMFSGCNSLNESIELNADILGIDCYNSMFEDCTNMSIVHSLNATSLSEGCYENMFKGCKKIKSPVNLEASILPDRCYKSMFESTGIEFLQESDIYETYFTYKLHQKGEEFNESISYLIKIDDNYTEPVDAIVDDDGLLNDDYYEKISNERLLNNHINFTINSTSIEANSLTKMFYDCINVDSVMTNGTPQLTTYYIKK